MMSQWGKHIFWKHPCMDYVVALKTAQKSSIPKHEALLWTFVFEFMYHIIHSLFSLTTLLQRSLTCYIFEENTRASGKKKKNLKKAWHLSDLCLSSKKSNIFWTKKSCGKNKTTQRNPRWNEDKLASLEELTGAERRTTTTVCTSVIGGWKLYKYSLFSPQHVSRVITVTRWF